MMASKEELTHSSPIFEVFRELNIGIISYLDLLSIKHLRLVHSQIVSCVSKDELMRQRNIRKSRFNDMTAIDPANLPAVNRNSYLCQDCYTLRCRSDFYMGTSFSSTAYSSNDRNKQIVICFVDTPCMLCHMAKLGDPRELTVCAPERCGLLYKNAMIKWGTCNLCRKVKKLGTNDTCKNCLPNMTQHPTIRDFAPRLHGITSDVTARKTPPPQHVENSKAPSMKAPTKTLRMTPWARLKEVISRQFQKLKAATIRLARLKFIGDGTV